LCEIPSAILKLFIFEVCDHLVLIGGIGKCSFLPPIQKNWEESPKNQTCSNNCRSEFGGIMTAVTTSVLSHISATVSLIVFGVVDLRCENAHWPHC